MTDMNWEAWQFLLGAWEGSGGGESPGQGTGGFTFQAELNGQILVRRNWAEYAASGARHEDHLTLYREEGAVQALYVDNEGHVIHYTARVTDAGVELVSAVSPVAPRFRLSFLKTTDGGLRIRFEMARPGQPDQFAVYTDGVVHRLPAR